LRPVELIHAAYVADRRARVLARHLERALPAGARVLDVGCGDGRIASRVAAARPDLEITGVDILVRPDARIRVEPFDGATIPYPDASFDAVMLVDVLHHADSPLALLQEAVRVAAREVVVKDVAAQTRLDHAILGFMDRVGNKRFGIAVLEPAGGA
jgi:ubiquinone/menaquinone biosynthesis C-methylase UbiE